jgi:hypothetical protein
MLTPLTKMRMARVVDLSRVRQLVRLKVCLRIHRHFNNPSTGTDVATIAVAYYWHPPDHHENNGLSASSC